MDVLLKDARKSAAKVADGYVVYSKAHASGATLFHRPSEDGVEDFVSFEQRPRSAEISYEVRLGKGARGLRLISNTLEILDSGGAPRLRVTPPYLVGSDGARIDATLAVAGCAVDKNPAVPWGRPVTVPGAENCVLRVNWRPDRVTYPAVLDPKWTSTGVMAFPRQDHSATLLSTGNVLVVGGRNSPTSTTGITQVEVYSRANAIWSTGTAIATGRWFHAAVTLGMSTNAATSARVLITGGINGTATVSAANNTALLYNVTDGTWAAAANMNVARHLHTATVLANGQVLVAGGMNNTTTLATAALYNPVTTPNGTWTAVANMASTRQGHTATLLSSSNTNFNNKVLIAGGDSGSSGTASLTSVQLFDPTGSTWTPASSTLAPAFATARERHTATRLTNGNVLVAGGKNGASFLNTAFVYTIPASGSTATWATTGIMQAMRTAHTATLLPTTVLTSGQVLLVGGSNGGALPSAELWNGTTWAPTTALSTAVQAHTAILLGSNMVLVAGGSNGTNATTASTLYDPSTGSTCTTNTQCASGFCVSGVCCDTACTNSCMACNLSPTVGTCSPKPANTACSDGSACTTGEACQAGTCTGGTTVTCTTDQCHTIGACVPTTGCPAAVNKTNGTTCSDGSACTTGEACQAGTCTGGTTVTCTTDQCHTIGACVPATGCPAAVNKTNGTTCNDSNACTQTDTCQSGACTGGNPKTCTASDQCHGVGTCDATTGACSNPVVTNGTTCTDGNACTLGDTCQTGTCTAGGPKTCTATDQCHTAGTCNTTTGACSTPVVTNGTVCNDANACTANETCQAGTCTAATTTTCTASDQCHVVGTCDASTGVCSNPIATNGATCNDGNTCTTTDTCNAGVCQPGPATACAGTGHYYAPIVELGAVGVAETRAVAINNSGEVVGNGYLANGFPRAFRYSYARGLTEELPSGPGVLESYAVNSAGVMAGYFYGGGGMFTSGLDGVWTHYYNYLVEGAILGSSVAYAINDSGQVVGYQTYPLNGALPPQAVAYTPDLGFRLLGTLPGPQYNGSTAAYGVSANGRIVGAAPTIVGPYGHAFMMANANATMVNLSETMTPGGPFDRLGLANATSDDYVVGIGFLTGGGATQDWTKLRGFRYHNDGSVESIGTLPLFATASRSSAVALNSRGDVVGNADDASGVPAMIRAILYTNEGQLIDLNDYVDPASGWILQYADGINDRKSDGTFEVVGTGRLGTGATRGFKIKMPDLSPCPASTLQCRGAGTRDLATGTCSYPLLTGAACNDTNACTEGDTCNAGVCAGTSTVPSDDANPCTTDSCDPAVGPVHTATNEGASCDDGNCSTTGDACHLGICVPGTAAYCTAKAKYFPPLVDLGAFGNEARGTIAAGVNNNGDVVGTGYFVTVHGV